jgi:hypothetical protein
MGAEDRKVKKLKSDRQDPGGGTVHAIKQYLGIKQITTGGHGTHSLL